MPNEKLFYALAHYTPALPESIPRFFENEGHCILYSRWRELLTLAASDGAQTNCGVSLKKTGLSATALRAHGAAVSGAKSMLLKFTRSGDARSCPDLSA